MSGLFLTYKVLFLKYIELFLKYLNLFVKKNTLVLESRKCNFMWPLAHHNNFKIANSPLLFLMSWFRENMVTKPLSKNHVCCKRSLGFFGGCRSEPQQFQRSKNWTVHINSNGCNEQGRASKEALLRTLWKLLFCFFVLFSFFVSVVLRGRRRQNIWAYVILCVAGVARIYVKCCVLVGVAGVDKICV